ncbi:MAG TPA: M14 family zinc carboxypeptidase [Candidatus Paceibacterota bacterium]|nr:M14 family zinc carboxypeptidase [Candidatus Paceibacterota bacterium]
MRGTSLLRVIIALIILAALGSFAWSWLRQAPEAESPAAPSAPSRVVVGHSVEGRPITAYIYGTGTTTIMFAGGMHGGYEWNAVLLAFEARDYFAQHPEAIPAGERVVVIPDLNPDGTFLELGTTTEFTEADVPAGNLSAGRFNAHHVDLNRNYACNWAATSTWQDKPESAGTAAFSEPEAQAVRAAVDEFAPAAVIFWHSASGYVYAADCNGTMAPHELDIMKAYAHAAGYGTQATFDAYPITGDSEGWLASLDIPALTVELTTHDSVEWSKNLAGIQALLSYFASSTSTAR